MIGFLRTWAGWATAVFAMIANSIRADAMVPCVCPPVVTYSFVRPIEVYHPPVYLPSHPPLTPSLALAPDVCPPIAMTAPAVPATPPMKMAPPATASPATPASNETPVELAKPMAAIPDAPKPETPKPETPKLAPKSEEPVRRESKSEPAPEPKKTETAPNIIPKLTLPTTGETPNATPKAEEPKTPKIDLPPFNFDPPPPKNEPKKQPELVIPAIGELKLGESKTSESKTSESKTSESKYTPSESTSVRLVPTEGEKPTDNARLAIFNYTDRDVALTIAGESHTIRAKSSLVLAVADGAEWQIANRKATLKLPADASGWQLILQ